MISSRRTETRSCPGRGRKNEKGTESLSGGGDTDFGEVSVSTDVCLDANRWTCSRIIDEDEEDMHMHACT